MKEFKVIPNRDKIRKMYLGRNKAYKSLSYQQFKDLVIRDINNQNKKIKGERKNDT